MKWSGMRSTYPKNREVSYFFWASVNGETKKREFKNREVRNVNAPFAEAPSNPLLNLLKYIFAVIRYNHSCYY